MIEVGCDTRYFACDECGIVEELDYRMRIADEHNEYLQFDHCGCDKVGDEFFMSGYCEDAFVEKPRPKKKGARKTGSAYRREQAVKKRNKRMEIVTRRRYNPFAGYVECDWVDDKFQPVGNHIKFPKNSNAQRYYKNQSNRRVRRYKGSLPNGNGYRKLYEYWWTLF